MDFWLIALVVVAVVAGLAVGQRLLHRKKVAAFTAYAERRGWQYVEKDQSLVDRFEGHPFDGGHSRRARHVLRGSHRGRDVVAFEYVHKETTGAGDDRETKIYYNTVVAVPAPAARPKLEVTRKGAGRMLLDFLGVRDLRLGSEEFDRTFRIRTDDEEFARDVLHPGMVAWLLAGHRAPATPFRFERADLLVWRPGEIDLSRVDELVEYVCDLLDRTPSSVWK